MITLDEMKTALRITNDALDLEIASTMEAAKMDLEYSGVSWHFLRRPDDALVNQAIRLYCRWQFNYCSMGAEYERAYKGLRDHLALVTPEEEMADEAMREAYRA